MSLMNEYHRRSDHGRAGAELGSLTCNCIQLFKDYNCKTLATILNAMADEMHEYESLAPENLRRIAKGLKPHQL